MDWTFAISTVSALGVGSFVGQYLIGARDRRQIRGEVLAQLSSCEHARWAHPEPGELTFSEAFRNLETAALVARIPREAVAQYKWLAQAAFWASEESLEEAGGDLEIGGGIDVNFAQAVRSSAAELTLLVWSPARGRVGLRRRLQRITTQAQDVGDPGAQRLLKRAERYVI